MLLSLKYTKIFTSDRLIAVRTNISVLNLIRRHAMLSSAFKGVWERKKVADFGTLTTIKKVMNLGKFSLLSEIQENV